MDIDNSFPSPVKLAMYQTTVADPAARAAPYTNSKCAILDMYSNDRSALLLSPLSMSNCTHTLISVFDLQYLHHA